MTAPVAAHRKDKPIFVMISRRYPVQLDLLAPCHIDRSLSPADLNSKGEQCIKYLRYMMIRRHQHDVKSPILEYPWEAPFALADAKRLRCFVPSNGDSGVDAFLVV